MDFKRQNCRRLPTSIATNFAQKIKPEESNFDKKTDQNFRFPLTTTPPNNKRRGLAPKEELEPANHGCESSGEEMKSLRPRGNDTTRLQSAFVPYEEKSRKTHVLPQDSNSKEVEKEVKPTSETGSELRTSDLESASLALHATEPNVAPPTTRTSFDRSPASTVDPFRYDSTSANPFAGCEPNSDMKHETQVTPVDLSSSLEPEPCHVDLDSPEEDSDALEDETEREEREPTEMEKREPTEMEEREPGQVTFDDIVEFDVGEMEMQTSDEDEVPSMLDIYQRCQTIRRKRFYADMYNAWEAKVEAEEREDALKILAACGFCPTDELGEEIDVGLSLVPDRFWQQESKANEICIEDLKEIVEEKKDAEKRRQFKECCAAQEKSHQGPTRRSAIIVGGGPSALLHNYLKMNLLNCRVPMYYLPSYLKRYEEMTAAPDDDYDEDEEDYT